MANLKINETEEQEIKSWNKLEALLICSSIINKNLEDKECKFFQKQLESVNTMKTFDWQELALHLLLREFSGELK